MTRSINNNIVYQKRSDENNFGSQFTEISQISNKKQQRSQILEQKNNKRMERTRSEVEDKLQANLNEIRCSESISTMTNPSCSWICSFSWTVFSIKVKTSTKTYRTE